MVIDIVPVPLPSVVAVPRRAPDSVFQVSLTDSFGPNPRAVIATDVPGTPLSGVRARVGVTVKVACAWRPLVAPRAITAWLPRGALGTVIVVLHPPDPSAVVLATGVVDVLSQKSRTVSPGP